VDRVQRAFSDQGLDAVVAIGGEHTMEITRQLHAEHGLPLIGVPKTIDNDVGGTDFTFGFDTAVQIVTDAIDRLHTTAQSHDRVMVVEVMGRNTGWIAAYAGLAGGADGIVIPETTTTVEEIADGVQRRHDRGKDFSIIVVAEGANLAFASGEVRHVRVNEETDEYGYERLGARLVRDPADLQGLAVGDEGRVERGAGRRLSHQAEVTAETVRVVRSTARAGVGRRQAETDPDHTVLRREHAVLPPLADARETIRHRDARALLAAEDRTNVDLGARVDQRIARVAGKELRPLALQHLCNELRTFHCAGSGTETRMRSLSVSRNGAPLGAS